SGDVAQAAAAPVGALVVEELQRLPVVERAAAALDVGPNVAVSCQEVRETIQIDVEEARAEGGERQTGLKEAGRLRVVREVAGALPRPEQRQPFSGEVADQYRFPAGVVVVRRVDPHSGALLPLHSIRDPGLQSDLRKGAVAIIPKEPVRLGVI